LSRQGYRIRVGSRDVARGEEAACVLSIEGIDLKPISIDVTDDASIIRAAALA